jgi:four helix bundle protein
MGYHRKLAVWQLSQKLAAEVSRLTRTFPPYERYELSSQMRRACSSISANIAEGTGKLGDRELARYLRIARGSASELDSHIDLARRLGYLTAAQEKPLLDSVLRIQRMLFALINRLTEGRGAVKAGP